MLSPEAIRDNFLIVKKLGIEPGKLVIYSRVALPRPVLYVDDSGLVFLVGIEGGFLPKNLTEAFNQ